MQITISLLLGASYAGETTPGETTPGGWASAVKPAGYELLYEGIGAHPWFQLPKDVNYPTISLDDCFEMVRDDPTCLAFGYF